MQKRKQSERDQFVDTKAGSMDESVLLLMILTTLSAQPFQVLSLLFLLLIILTSVTCLFGYLLWNSSFLSSILSITSNLLSNTRGSWSSSSMEPDMELSRLSLSLSLEEAGATPPWNPTWTFLTSLHRIPLYLLSVTLSDLSLLSLSVLPHSSLYLCSLSRPLSHITLSVLCFSPLFFVSVCSLTSLNFEKERPIATYNLNPNHFFFGVGVGC